jgi:hypothetical protein
MHQRTSCASLARKHQQYTAHILVLISCCSASTFASLGCCKQLPVLRNRRRAFVFGESAFDSFGPSGFNNEVPEEMSPGALYGGTKPYQPMFESRGKSSSSSNSAGSSSSSSGSGSVLGKVSDWLSSQSDDHVRSK